MISPITEIPIPFTYYFCILFTTAYIFFIYKVDFIVNVTIDKLFFFSLLGLLMWLFHKSIEQSRLAGTRDVVDTLRSTTGV